ncbi:MAG: glycosyltransferase [Mycobacteriales bacterium]
MVSAVNDDDGISVVLCVRNAESTIGEQLEALSRQTFGNWELVVVDNGCTDGTLHVVEAWRPRLPHVRVVPAPEKPGLAYARNVGVRAATRSAIAFCDGDDAVDAGWLTALWQDLQVFDHVGGRLDVAQLNDPDAIFWRGGAPMKHGLYIAHGYLPHAIGANFAVWRDVFLEVGGCDEQFVICSDDVDLSWRIQEAGRTLGFSPDAVVHYRLRSAMRDAVRQQWNYGRTESLLCLKYGDKMKPQPWVPYLQFMLRVLPRVDHLVRSRRLRGRWLCLVSYRAGRLYGAAKHRVMWR